MVLVRRLPVNPSEFSFCKPACLNAMRYFLRALSLRFSLITHSSPPTGSAINTWRLRSCMVFRDSTSRRAGAGSSTNSPAPKAPMISSCRSGESRSLNVSDVQREPGADVASHVSMALGEARSWRRFSVPLNNRARPLRSFVRLPGQHKLIAAGLSLLATDVNGFARQLALLPASLNCLARQIRVPPDDHKVVE